MKGGELLDELVELSLEMEVVVEVSVHSVDGFFGEADNSGWGR